MRQELDVLVVGGGSFGTALAHVLAIQGRAVLLWVRRPELADEINAQHCNHKYLPDLALAATLVASTDLAAVRGARTVIVAVPSRSFREVVRGLGEHLTGDQIVLHATKGIEMGTGQRMSEILRAETCALKIGVLSGPNFARELVLGSPSGALVASRYEEVVTAAQGLFAGSRLRAYGGRDVVGTEVGGAFKNIIALAAGVSDGLGFGANAKALLLTRGLSEMARFGVALGADVFTFGGLAGIGDLMATCSSPLSRNRAVGERLGKGEGLAMILESMPYVAEGVPTTGAVHEHAVRAGLQLPIVDAVFDVLHGQCTAAEVAERLMRIPVGEELSALRFN